MDMKVDTSFPLFSLYSIWYYFRLVTSSMLAAFPEEVYLHSFIDGTTLF